MDLSEFLYTRENEKILIIYPSNDVFLSVSKTIADAKGREKLGWLVFDDLGKSRLETFFEKFMPYAPEFPGKIFKNMDTLENGIETIFCYGFHFAKPKCGIKPVFKLILQKGRTIYFFLLENSIEEKEEVIIKDLFDAIVKIEEKDITFEKKYTYSVREYVFPFRYFSGTFRIGEDYSILE
ncbi:hypothetical protein [Geoglobus acetivorans]|uniref:KaiC-like domain-containing protein n=1 Tax=Geoglobus acetivorans TaxID=565033 RepID=A0ABZ3H2A5_GEOAI|nr:hypothetical protein [Geoglobus acetivorans]